MKTCVKRSQIVYIIPHVTFTQIQNILGSHIPRTLYPSPQYKLCVGLSHFFSRRTMLQTMLCAYSRLPRAEHVLNTKQNIFASFRTRIHSAIFTYELAQRQQEVAVRGSEDWFQFCSDESGSEKFGRRTTARGPSSSESDKLLLLRWIQ